MQLQNIDRERDERKGASNGIINDLENQLSLLISKEAKGAKIRSHTQWFEEGEKPTRYFFHLEQTRAVSNSFGSLFDENGIEKSSQQDLEKILTQFYQTLFSSNFLDMQIQTDIIDALEFSLTDYVNARCVKAFGPVKRLVLMAFQQNFIFISGTTLVIHYFLFSTSPFMLALLLRVSMRDFYV